MANTVTLRPGARGTIRLSRKYGAKLVCVRYRYNTQTKNRVKTVELIVDERSWAPQRLDEGEIWHCVEGVENKTAEQKA